MLRYLRLFAPIGMMLVFVDATDPQKGSSRDKTIGSFEVISSKTSASSDNICAAIKTSLMKSKLYQSVTCSSIEEYTVKSIRIKSGSFRRNIRIYSGSIEAISASPEDEGQEIPIYMVEDGVGERRVLYLDHWRSRHGAFYFIDGEKSQ